MTLELIKSVVYQTDSKPIEKNQLFCYLAYMFTEFSYTKVSNQINKSRVSSFYSVKAIKNRIQTDKQYKSKVNEIKGKLIECNLILNEVENQNENLLKLALNSIEIALLVNEYKTELSNIKTLLSSQN